MSTHEPAKAQPTPTAEVRGHMAPPPTARTSKATRTKSGSHKGRGGSHHARRTTEVEFTPDPALDAAIDAQERLDAHPVTPAEPGDLPPAPSPAPPTLDWPAVDAALARIEQGGTVAEISTAVATLRAALNGLRPKAD